MQATATPQGSPFSYAARILIIPSFWSFKSFENGILSLKGKAKAVETYQIVTIDKPEAPNKLLRKGFLREQTLLYTKTK